MIQRLFVHGTLAPGRPDEHVLEDLPGEWEPATVRGEPVQQDWGADAGFAGIALDEDGPEAEGFVLSSAALDRHGERLDDFEVDEYERVLAPTASVRNPGPRRRGPSCRLFGRDGCGAARAHERPCTGGVRRYRAFEVLGGPVRRSPLGAWHNTVPKTASRARYSVKAFEWSPGDTCYRTDPRRV